MTELDEASAEWHALIKILDEQIADGDSAPVELWAMRAVRALLLVHEPHANVFGVHPVCGWCIDARHDRPERWSCETYRLIDEEAMREQ